MPTKTICLWAIASAASLFGACDTSNKPAAAATTTEIEYYIRYTEHDFTLKAEAMFRTKDTARKVPGGVMLNGTALVETNAPRRGGVLYSAQGQKAKFDSSYSFSYSDPNLGKLLTHKVNFQSAREVQFESGVLSKAKGGKLRWTGKPLRNGEELLLQIEGKGGVKEIRIVGPTVVPGFALGPNQTDLLEVGAATVNAVRLQRVPLPESLNTRGVIGTEFYAETVKINIIP